MKNKKYIIGKIRDIQRRLKDESMPRTARQFMIGELMAYRDVAEINWMEQRKLRILEE